jgi:hypothetical protein
MHEILYQNQPKKDPKFKKVKLVDTLENDSLSTFEKLFLPKQKLIKSISHRSLSLPRSGKT